MDISRTEEIRRSLDMVLASILNYGKNGGVLLTISEQAALGCGAVKTAEDFKALCKRILDLAGESVELSGKTCAETSAEAAALEKEIAGRQEQIEEMKCSFQADQAKLQSDQRNDLLKAVEAEMSRWEQTVRKLEREKKTQEAFRNVSGTGAALQRVSVIKGTDKQLAEAQNRLGRCRQDYSLLSQQIGDVHDNLNGRSEQIAKLESWVTDLREKESSLHRDKAELEKRQWEERQAYCRKISELAEALCGRGESLEVILQAVAEEPPPFSLDV